MADGDGAMTPVGDESVVLAPGSYWIELEVDREGATQALVERSLSAAGFEDVRLDTEASAGGTRQLAGFGALMPTGGTTTASTLSSLVTRTAAATAPVSSVPSVASTLSKMIASSAPAPAPASPIQNLLARTAATSPSAPAPVAASASAALFPKPSSSSTPSPLKPRPSGGSPLAVSRTADLPKVSAPVFHPATPSSTGLPPDPGPLPKNATAIEKAIWAARKSAYDAAVAAQKKAAGKSGPRGRGLGLGGGGGGDGSPPAPPPPEPVADPNDDRYATDPSTGKKYFMDPTTGEISLVDPQTGGLVPVDQTSLEPTGGAESPAPPPPGADDGGGGGDLVGPAGQSVDPASVMPATTDTTASPVRTGDGPPPADAPLGEDPAYAIHVDEISGTSPNVYRLVARAPDKLVLRNGHGVWWKSVRRLSIDPYAEPPLRSPSFPLARGQLYELLFFSRDKKARARADVWTLLEAMGFRPLKMLLLKRDVRLPARGSQGTPAATVSVWMALGRWDKPQSLTTAEDPFFFADVRPAA